MPKSIILREFEHSAPSIVTPREYFQKKNRPEVVEALDEWEAREKRVKYMLENGLPVQHEVRAPKVTWKTQPPKKGGP